MDRDLVQFIFIARGAKDETKAQVMIVCETINTELTVDYLWESQFVCREQNWASTGSLKDTEGQVSFTGSGFLYCYHT